MAIFISHESALAYWQSGRANPSAGKGRDVRARLEAYDAAGVDLSALEMAGFGIGPLHVMVCDSSSRSGRRCLKEHVCSDPLPKGAFEHVTRDIWVATPELVYYQLARRLSAAEAVKLGSELCAAFYVDSLGALESREPLTTPGAIRSFGARLQGRQAAPTAERMARYIVGGAASPMEIAVAVLLTSPRVYGGYGLPQCELNAPIRLGSDRQKTYYGDLVWTEQRVIVEYDSNEFHVGAARINKDALRRNTLLDAGWTVLTLTRDQVLSAQSSDIAATQIARALKHRVSYEPVGAQMKRRELRAVLLPAVSDRR